jgi:beta-lactamase class A
VGIYSDIESDIVDYLKSEINKKNLYGYSFYFRDLTSGLWFGSNESANFAPASLFKLPIAIAIYKQIENDSGLLQKKLLYTQELSDINTVKQLNSDSTLVVGQLYAVDELVEKMLVYSDNGAKNLLLSVIDKKYLDQLLNLVNFSNNPNNTTYDISSRKYANFLRIVYGSSYINEEHSEYILSLLARSDFKDGIVAGLPSTVTVAHKYGVYEFPEQIEGKEVLTVQLHDCGVVYHQSNPYVFCLMTKGKDDASLFKIISTVSRMMYKHQEVYAGGDI